MRRSCILLKGCRTMPRKRSLNYREKCTVPGPDDPPKLNMTFSEKVIDKVFRPLKLGQLTIHWPDSSRRIYGLEPDGITAEIHARRHDFFKKCLLYGDVGFGEAYVDGDWDTPDLVRV